MSDNPLDPNRSLSPEALARFRAESRPFDIAEELETAEDISAFLDEYLMDNDDPAAFTKALGHVARAVGMTAIAAKAGVGRASLYKSLSGDVAPSFETITKVMAALGVRLTVTTRAAADDGQAAA